MTTTLANLSISARLVLDLHSLNNEGGEGNQIQTRMVNIVDRDGVLYSVNAISGDMFKHIQAEHLFQIARAEGLPLSAGAQVFDANRINADAEFVKRVANFSDGDVLADLLQTCAVSDMEGILVTEGKKSVARKSVIEFGWVTGVPEQVQTDSYFHVKYAQDRSTSQRDKDRQSQVKTGSNLGQSIFHRPANSGVYAVVCHLNLARIGFNDILQNYTLTYEERVRRAHALIRSVLYTFVQPNGAMRSTQAPHLLGMSGVVTISSKPIPAPTVSPLAESYREEVEATVGVLNQIEGEGSVSLAMFDDMSMFADTIRVLLDDMALYGFRV
ncbi:MAG: DevR family CRISPR-associated autoregulator [Phototrophicaceae bacterium]